MASKIKLNEVVLTSPNGLVEKTLRLNDDGTVSIDAQIVGNGQIKFPTTQNVSTDPNTLDDYKEGTWTPTIIGGTTAGVGTYDARDGSYVKIGKLVYLHFTIICQTHTGTGNLLISGLPFNAIGNHSSAIYLSDTTFTGSYVTARTAIDKLEIRSSITNASASFVQIDSSVMILVCSMTYITS